jgi:hypothetical protein
MPFVHRCGYGFADLFYDFTGDFLIFYLRWLYGFDFGGHFATSCLECTRFLRVRQGEKFDVLAELIRRYCQISLSILSISSTALSY